MRALQFDQQGPPDVLHVAEVPEPHAGPGQIRVATRAVAVNPIDWKIRQGGMIEVELPFIGGGDVAGVVDEVGDGVTDVTVGDTVFGAATGAGAAESVVLQAWAKLPEGLTCEEAAGFVTAAETSVRSMDIVGVGDGTVLVIAGAAGGVGSAAVQLAVARGARVIGTASEANHDYVRSLGAEPTTYGDGLVERVRAITNHVDAGFDTAGKGAVADLIELTGDPDKVVSIADFSGHGAHVTSGSQGRSWQALQEAADLSAAGQFSLPVEQVFTFEDAAEAHERSEAGHVRGKLVLTP
jgi:NADPH:quinone reductase-like Zn-dependent oxidoreductase